MQGVKTQRDMPVFIVVVNATLTRCQNALAMQI